MDTHSKSYTNIEASHTGNGIRNWKSFFKVLDSTQVKVSYTLNQLTKYLQRNIS